MNVQSHKSTGQQLWSDWIHGNWYPALCTTAWQQFEETPTAQSLYLALKIQNAITGIEARHLDIAMAAAHELNCRWHAVTLRLISSCLQLKRDDMACQLLENQLKGPLTPTRYLLLSRNPSVLSLLHQAFPDRFSRVLLALKRSAISLFANCNTLDNESLTRLIDCPVLDSKVTVAIVGNSPALLIAANGQDIDRHQLVIRFNRVHISRATYRHTGSKTDLLMVSPEAAKTLRKTHPCPVIVSGCNPWHSNSRYWQRFANLDKPTLQVPSDVWHALVARLNAPPSAGLLALACLSKDSNLAIRTFGLTTSEQFCTTSQGLHYADNNKPSNRHNWRAEARLVSELTRCTI